MRFSMPSRMAREQALAGDLQVAETLEFASDLLYIIADGLNSPEADPAAAEAFVTLREMLRALRAELRPPGALHSVFRVRRSLPRA